MNIVVRSATLADLPAILAMGQGDDAFTVSDRIRFYEKAELEEWIASPKDNILLVANSSSDLAGFLFCKIMSYHWAMLDNFYIHPSFRGQNCDGFLMEELAIRLRQRGISYLTTLTAHDQPALARYIKRHGFRTANLYEWNELFLDR